MSFTQAEKDMALDMYRSQGASAAAKATGCSRQSIYQWLADSLSVDNSDPSIKAAEVIAKNTVMREYMRERLLYAAMRFVDRAVEPFSWVTPKGNTVELEEPPGFEVDKLMRAAQSALMLYRLEMGEATSRTITEGADDIDRSVVQLVAEMARRSETETS